jgi:hypothetical protein
MECINSLGCRQVVTYGTNTTKALHQHGNFPVGMPLNETLKATEFYDMKPGFDYPAFLIQMDGYFAVAFHPGYGINDNFLCHGG